MFKFLTPNIFGKGSNTGIIKKYRGIIVNELTDLFINRLPTLVLKTVWLIFYTFAHVGVDYGSWL
jgi:hypothetical protein